jgi:putative DNA primase/helicase
MTKEQFEERFQQARKNAFGRWTSILLALGVDEKVLNRRNQPCPLAGCGGTDRFQYTDKFGDGNYVCRACGAGGGFKLLMGYFGWSAATTLRCVERTLCMQPAQSSPKKRTKDITTLVHRILSETTPIAFGDEVDRYLRNRGLGMECYPDALRTHPALGYYEVDAATGRPVLVGHYPAMVAKIYDRHGELVSLHRTYLEDGHKISGRDAKKLLCGGVDGGSIRLGPAGAELAVCEGIETGLAILKRTGQPIWVGICAGNLENMWIPDEVRRLRVYGDNDADSMFDGQASAYALARQFLKRRVAGDKRSAEVFIPRAAGADWANVLSNQPPIVERAA